MKQIKLSVVRTLLLLFSAGLLVISCNENELQEQVEDATIENLNTLSNRQKVKNLFTKGTESNSKLEKLKAQKDSNKSELNQLDIDVMIDDYKNCSECPSEYKDFLIPFFKEISNTEDELIISKINEYQARIKSTGLSDTHIENLKFTIYSFKEAAQYALDNPDSKGLTTKNSTGNTIGRGLAGGFLMGCATGAYIGGTAGTVTVPIIGTVVGAVSGCIAAGAWGAVTGATSAGIWSALDAIF